MTKLTVICNDEETEARVLHGLHNDQEFSISGAIVVRNVRAEAQNFLNFLNKAIDKMPDVIILDMAVLREAAAIDMKRLMDYVRKFSSVRFIILGNRYHEQNVIAMMRGGARGFVQKDHLEEDIAPSVRVVTRGEVWLSPGLLGRVCGKLLMDSQKSDMVKSPTSEQLVKLNKISHREMEVLELVSESLTNEEIAQKLFLSNKTVKTHIRNIFEKIGVRNRTEAALLFTRYHQEIEYHLKH